MTPRGSDVSDELMPDIFAKPYLLHDRVGFRELPSSKPHAPLLGIELSPA
jgi:hypothetical protein